MRSADEPLSPKQVAAILEEKEDTIRQRLIRMAHDGEVVKRAYGKYARPRLSL